MPTTTFDSGNLVSGTLSGGALVYTSTNSGATASNRTITGLTYAEITLTTITGVPSVGVVGRNWNPATTTTGTDATSVGYYSSGAVKYNNVTIATLATYTSADRIGIAVDWANRLIWFRKNGGNWNGSALNDPATGVGGLSFANPLTTAATMGTALFGVTASLTGTVWTANFSGAFVDAAPAGFVTIDTQQITLARSVDPDQMAPLVALTTTTIARVGMMPSDRCSPYFSPAGPVTKVSGTILEVGATVGGKRVDVYDRVSGELLGTTFSASDGTWSVACLGRPSVRVVADDPTTYNSLVYDNVIPV